MVKDLISLNRLVSISDEYIARYFSANWQLLSENDNRSEAEELAAFKRFVND